MTNPLRLVTAPESVEDLRAKARATLMARIAGSIPEREDEKRFEGGHVWRRNRSHEELVLRVLGRRFG